MNRLHLNMAALVDIVVVSGAARVLSVLVAAEDARAKEQ